MGRGSSKIDRGSTRGVSSSGINRSKKTMDEIIETMSNSKFKGVARNAINGEGRYYFNSSKKHYEIMSDKDAEKVKASQIMRVDTYLRDDSKTVINIYKDGKDYLIAGNSDTPIIKKLVAKNEAIKKANVALVKNAERPEIRTTSTYDRWKKRHDANFAAWFGTDRIEKINESTKIKKKKK